MNKPDLDKNYWTKRYKSENTPWDIGYAAPSIINYVTNKVDKGAEILIPGAGNAYEAVDLFKAGYNRVKVLDFSEAPLKDFRQKHTSFPERQLICQDFFDHDGNYDLIIEQTFFCALDPDLRPKYAEKMLQLLKPGAHLMGVLFDAGLNKDQPPFGGNKEEYLEVFKDFDIKIMERNKDSIKPRQDRELFILLQKPSA